MQDLNHQQRNHQKRTQSTIEQATTYRLEMVWALLVYIILPTLGFNHLNVAPGALDPWELSNLGRPRQCVAHHLQDGVGRRAAAACRVLGLAVGMERWTELSNGRR
jgi:hypothetical protein